MISEDNDDSLNVCGVLWPACLSTVRLYAGPCFKPGALCKGAPVVQIVRTVYMLGAIGTTRIANDQRMHVDSHYYSVLTPDTRQRKKRTSKQRQEASSLGGRRG